MTTTLRLGSRGGRVRLLQQRLNERLVPSDGLARDGLFGPLTREAVFRFQQQNHLRLVDGVVGPETSRALLGEFAVDYQVPGANQIPHIRQAGDNTCWAATAAMLLAWRLGNSRFTERQAAEYADQHSRTPVSPTYVDRVQQDVGFDAEETGPFADACGFQHTRQQNYSVGSLMRLMRAHGPLGLITQASAPHGRVLIGLTIFGRGSAEETFLTIIDSARGDVYEENLTTFVEQFERLRLDWEHLWYNP